ncbi:MAG: hypothetical protein HYT03_01890 [Candidatus Harrisonbacteria bacterium]|nr:hypothetical protein [Candidatus Harrisonbacteria bacterium]
MNTNFPDKGFLNGLAKQMREKVQNYQDPVEQLLTNCSAAMNWIADYITDENVEWTKEELTVDSLWLTGTNPEWNEVIIKKGARSPSKLHELIKTDKTVAGLFSELKFDEVPILVRLDEEKYKVLDGMKRVIAAIRDDRITVVAFVAIASGVPAPKCEPHVVYDLLRSYQRGTNKDQEGLIAALRFLRKSYANVSNLLINRFDSSWIAAIEVREIIQEALQD